MSSDFGSHLNPRTLDIPTPQDLNLAETLFTQDPSISSLERQLLTDEKLTPGSSSVSRGNFHSTRSPPSSGRKAGDSSQGRNGDLLALEQRPSTDRSSPPGGLALPRMSNGGLQRRPLSTNDESKAMPPPTSSPIQHHASAAGLVGEASEPKSRSRGNERTRESSGLPDPVQSGQEPSQDATPPEHSPGSQTQSLFQSQAEQAVSQRTPGTDLPPEKSGRNDGLYGSPSPNVAFQLRLSGSSSSPSKSPGSEKLSQTGGGLLESVTLRGQSRVLAYGESGRATPDGGTAELGNGTEALKQGGGLFENESRRLSEGARRVAESSGGGMEGGMTEMEGGTERLEGKLARDAGGMANMAGGLAGSEHGKGELKDGTEQMEGGTAGLESRRLEAEGGTADFEHGRAKGERGTAEVLLTAANGAEGAAFTGKKLLSESREAHVTRRVELTEGLLLQVRRIVDKSAVEKAGAPGTLSTGQRISGALSRGRNDPADPGTQNNNEKAADMEEGQGALSLPEAAAERSLSHAEVRGYELELQNPVFPVRELPANHQSEPFSGGGKRSDVVPPGAALDSEEGGTHSSGRGVNPGATPPPSSKSCSRDDLPERARGVVPDERKPDKADRLLNNRASAANSEDGSETASESGETELVPETEETEEETEEQGCGQEKASLGREPTLAASPCRASESPGMSGSQPLSQSQVF